MPMLDRIFGASLMRFSAACARSSALVLLLLACPTAAQAICAFPPVNDADCDGIVDAADPCASDTLNRCLVDVATCRSSSGSAACTPGTPLRLNFGNTGNLTDCNLDQWLDDPGAGQNFTGTVDSGPIADAFGCSNAATVTLVASESFNPVLTRSYPIPNGTYLVNFLFAEAFSGACVLGSRTMDVSLEGAQVEGGASAGDGIDQYALSLALNSGGNAADPDACGGLVVRSHEVAVSNGFLDLSLTEDDAGVGDANASIKAIEVRVVSLPCAAGEDDDGDGICIAADNCPDVFSLDTTDGDGDGIGDVCDNCPDLATGSPEDDPDMDGLGDACDVCPGDGLNDEDGDGICAGTGFSAPKTGDGDNCPSDPNPGQANADGDDRGDACDFCPNDTGAAEDACLGAGSWVARTSSTIDRHEAGAAAVDGLIYHMGGEEAAAGQTLEIYDPATDTWSNGPSLPTPRHHIQPVVVGRKIYVIGGLLQWPGPSVDTVFVLDTENLASGWQTKSPMPTTRGAQGCAADGVKIYCAGGLSSSAGNTAIDVLEVYNTVTDEWDTLAPMPRVRDHFQAQIVGGKFYAIGGRDTIITTPFAFNDVYDIATDTWSPGAPLPTARGGYASVVIEGRIVVVGGEGDGPSSGTFPDVDEYDPSRDQWRPLADMLTSRHSVAAAVSRAADGVHPRIYALTGGEVQGASASKLNEEFAYDECSAGGDCDDGDPCTADACSANRCAHDVEPVCDAPIFIEAATDPSLQLFGSMTYGAEFASGDDADPNADSHNCFLLFADSTQTDFSPNPNRATYQVVLPSGGSWFAWGRFYYAGSDNDANSFWLQVDAQPALKFGNNKDFFEVWHWDGDGEIENGAVVPLALGPLTAGAHTITVMKREVTPIPPRLDMIMLTLDQNTPPSDLEALSSIESCQVDADCNDGKTCTDELCNAGTCERSNNSDPCDDGIFCNGADTCAAGSCSLHAGDPCAGGGECANVCNEAAETCALTAGTACTDDGEVCTDDVCDGDGACSHPPNVAACDDGLFCNGADTCSNGTCSEHAGDPCTGGPECADACNEAEASCDAAAGTACTDDGSSCSADECDGAGSCIHPPLADGEACDDGVACTTGDTCQSGACTSGADGCAGAQVCNHTTGQCEDPPDCTLDEECDDQNPCTDDSCDGGTCAHAANDAACDDGQFCTVDDTCSNEVCGGTPQVCDDGIDCTIDSCDEAADACTAVPDHSSCQDASICNGAETCEPAVGCQPASAPLDCSGLDTPCGNGVCDEGAGPCVVEPQNDGAACDDADPCTANETCSAGTCEGEGVTNIEKGRLNARLKPGADNDKLAIRAQAPLAALTADPTTAGAALALWDPDGTLLFVADVPADAFEDVGGKGRDFRFKDPDALVASANGLGLLRIKGRPAGGIVKVRARLRAGEMGALGGRPELTLSLVVGAAGVDSCLAAFSAPCVGNAVRVRCSLP